MKISVMKIISLISTLLILFCTVPGTAFAEEGREAPPFASDEESFDEMKSRMEESISSMIENLEDSEEDLDEDLVDEAEELITELEQLQTDLEDVETESELLEIKTELDSLIEETSDDLKDVLGSSGQGEQGMNSGQGRSDGNGAPEQGTEGGSESDPSMQGTEGGPERDSSMMQNRSQAKDGNATEEDGAPEERKMSEQSSDGNKGNAEETESESTGFFGQLLSSIKSLFG